MANDKNKPVNTLIKDAFMELMNRKYYMDITVTDVVNEAHVARASFYRNFNSMNDVLTEIIDDMTDNINGTLIPVLSSNDESEWREFLFNFIYDFRAKQKSLMTGYPSNVSIILFRLNEKLSQLRNNLSDEKIDDKYRLPARFGLIVMILKNWVNTGMKESPEELVNYLIKLIPEI